MSSAYRGRGGRRYRRTRDRMARQAQATNATCPSCGKPYDFDNPNSPQGFNGQHLTGLCRACNGRKSNHITPTLKPAS